MEKAEGMFLPANPERQYYSRYTWCLCPALTIRELRLRLDEEWRSRDLSTALWQRGESHVNLYLLLSALHSTAADYLADRPIQLVGIGRRLGKARALAGQLKILVNAPHVIAARAPHGVVERWNARAASCLDAICRILVDEPCFGDESWTELERTVPLLVRSDLPEQALVWRMRIPEAYRCQDLAHTDAFNLAARVAQRSGLDDRPIFIVGPRTAGAYFAPLVHAYLLRHGIATQGWVSIRPKAGMTRSERRRISKAIRDGCRIAVIDDHPNTGDTFVLILRILTGLGAHPKDLLFVAPQHPAESDWAHRVSPVEVVRLPSNEFHKSRLLGDDARLLAIVRELSFLQGWQDFRIVRSAQADEVNDALDAQFGRSFQTRLKRCIEIQACDPSGGQKTVRLLFKSVGWGWLGYHAYLAGMGLANMVPQVFGLREGFLIMQWIGPFDPLLPVADREAIGAAAPAYIAQRVLALRVPEDPWMTPAGYRAAGWDRLMRSLRRPLGPLLGRCASPLLRKELRDYVTPFPTLVDGRMGRENWLITSRHPVKCDFEHHNFGGGEEDFVDPAFDLAGVFFELEVSATDEEHMVEDYIHRTGDHDVRPRLLLYKLLVGQRAMADAAYYLDRNISDARKASENLRYLSGRNYLTYQFNRLHAERLPKPTQLSWNSRVFFLDLDGVFDTQSLGGFPHTTTHGLIALSLLRRNGYSVVPNTGRSVKHVRNYCDEYALPGGIAEYGCVVVDRVRGCEYTLAEPDTLKELEYLREVLSRREKLFLDPDYGVAIHTYRLENGSLVGPSKLDLETLLERESLHSLEVLVTEADGYILPKNLGKRRGMETVVSRLERDPELTVAMGDSEPDIGMLQAADVAYVPMNSAPEVRGLALSSDKIHLIRAQNQRALLKAVVDLIQRQHGEKIDRSHIAGVRPPVHLIDRILDLAGQSARLQWFQVTRARLSEGRLEGWKLDW